MSGDRACLRCRAPSDIASIRPVFGLDLCSPCARELQAEVRVRANALADQKARSLAASWMRRVPLVDRDPLERVIRAAFVAAGELGVFEVARAILNPEYSARVRRNRELAMAAHEVEGSERSGFEAGRACGQELAAVALGRAIELLADPRCDLRAVLNELRDAVESVRTCELLRVAKLHAERGENPRPWAPRRRIVSGKIGPRSFHSDRTDRGEPPLPGQAWDPDLYVRWGDLAEGRSRVA